MGCLGSKPSQPEKKEFSAIGDEKKANGFEYMNGKPRRSIDQVQITQQYLIHQHQSNLNTNQLKQLETNNRRFNGNTNKTEDSSSVRYTQQSISDTTNIPSSDSGNGSATSNNLNFNTNINVGNNKSKNAYVAIFDYVARTDQDLSFKKGDILYIKEEDKLSNGWWFGLLKSTEGGKKSNGYIPSQYVAELGSLEAQSWYFGSTKRMEAEKLLMLDANRHGSFLIRVSDGNNHAYSLSVRDNETVKHYRIRLSDDGLYFYITKRVPFGTLNDLVSLAFFAFAFFLLL